MKAVIYHSFKGEVSVQQVKDPEPTADAVIVKVEATGLCRSDWHGWMGHDADIKLPHIPGHELAGVVETVGKNVKKWKRGDRVTVPFSGGCGYCPQCQQGQQQICDNYFQPGFTHWGSFAEYVSINYADLNLVRLPSEMDFVTAASLGCRFVTAFRAVVSQGKVKAGDWVAIHGCGGLGLSAIMIAHALGAQVIAIDIEEQKLKMAKAIGASFGINALKEKVPQAIKAISNGGVHISIDALGSTITCQNSVYSLRKRGRHIQVGLMVDNDSHPPIPMGQVMSNELEILGSHGIQAHQYGGIFNMIENKQLSPEKLIGSTISLYQAPKYLMDMDSFSTKGVTVIDNFEEKNFT